VAHRYNTQFKEIRCDKALTGQGFWHGDRRQYRNGGTKIRMEKPKIIGEKFLKENCSSKK